jgi:hypothetical protein
VPVVFKTLGWPCGVSSLVEASDVEETAKKKARKKQRREKKIHVCV